MGIVSDNLIGLGTPSALADYIYPGLIKLQSIAYSASIPLNGINGMPRQVVSGSVTFVPALNPIPGCSCYIRMIADGSNTPIFSVFKECGASSGYNNTQGIDNQITFWYDGIDYWFTVQQQVNAQAVAVPYYVNSYVAEANPNKLIVTASVNLNSSVVPSVSSFSISASGGAVTVNSISISANLATLTLSRSILVSETVSISYTKPSSNAIIDSTSIFVMPTFSGKSVSWVYTNAVVRYPTRTNITEAADASFGYDYTSSASSSYNGTGTTTTALPSSSDGFLGGTMAGLDSGGLGALIGLKQSSSNIKYSSGLDYGIYADSTNSQYSCVTDGTGSGDPDVVVTRVVGDIMRMRRTGTSVYGEISKDGGVTWTIIKTWTGATSNALYGCLNLDTGMIFNKAFSSTNWA